MNWSDLNVAIVGGDRREQEIARCAAATGARVRAYGFPWPEGGIDRVQHTADAASALKDADFALFPIPGIAPNGALFAPSCPERIIPTVPMLSGMRKPAHIILGWADKNLKECCEALGIGIHEYEWDDDLMLLRSRAIVEGMLKVIIENTDVTIHRAKVCQVGQGTIGSLVTQTLYALGARVHVVARNPVQRAQAYAAGAESYDFSQIGDAMSGCDILVSSVPAQVVTEEMLQKLPKHTLLVDLAAPPGGIDRDATKRLGLKFVWARGLGSRAPVTVGRSQWSGISRRIESLLEQRR
jgi:dipicolinate synthase subunit A